MSLPDLELKLYPPTPLQRRIEQAITNGVGVNQADHLEESILAVQEHIGTLDTNTGNPN